MTTEAQLRDVVNNLSDLLSFVGENGERHHCKTLLTETLSELAQLRAVARAAKLATAGIRSGYRDPHNSGIYALNEALSHIKPESLI